MEARVLLILLGLITIYIDFIGVSRAGIKVTTTTTYYYYYYYYYYNYN